MDVLHDLRPEALIHAIEANLFAQWAWLGRVPGVELADDGKSLRFTTGVPHPIFNGVFRARFTAEEADAEIEKTVAHFQSRGLPFLWWLGPATRPADLGERLAARGFVSAGEPVGMAADLHALNDAIPAPPTLTIQHIGDREALQQACGVICAGFELPDSLAETWLEMMLPLGLEPDLPLRGYLGWLGGCPVATAWLFLAEGVAGIYTVTTIPEARRQGTGAAMTLAALRAGRDAGYRIGILHASPMGESVYRRIGFREYCRLSLYAWPAEAAER